jgi:hypothetical protein
MQATSTLTLRYVGPGDVAAVLNFNAELEYIASAAGFLDIPAATADGISFAVPFGTIGAAKGIALQNNTPQNLEVSINASEDVFVIAPNALFLSMGEAASGITSVSVLTTALTTVQGTVAYIVLGDTPV